MSTINDSEDTASIISDMTSIHGTNCANESEMQRIIRQQREEIERLRKAQEIPTWVTSETEAVDQSWDQFRRTFERVKEQVVQQKSLEDLSGNFTEMKESAKANDEMTNVWMATADDLKKYLGKLNSKLKDCCPLDGEENEHSKHQDKVQLSNDEEATDSDAEIYPALNKEDEKECDYFIGTMHRSQKPFARQDCIYLPLKISIKKLKNGFYHESRHFDDGKVTFFKWRPDNRERDGSRCISYSPYRIVHHRLPATYEFQFEVSPLDSNVVIVFVRHHNARSEHDYFMDVS